MTHPLTSEDSYTTPNSIPRALRNYLLLGTRWATYSWLIRAIRLYRPYAVRSEYTDELWAHSSIELLHNLERSGARFIIEGLHNLKLANGPAVIVANHMSTLETVILPGLVAPILPCTFVAKEGLAKGPVWGPIMKSRNPILVTRKDARKDLTTVLNEGARILSEGRSVIIFPEGTRRSPFVREGFNSLGIKLAVKAGVPIIPVAVRTDFWGNSQILKGFGPVRKKIPVHFRIGKPLTIQGRGKDEHEQILDYIEACLREWGAPVQDTGK